MKKLVLKLAILTISVVGFLILSYSIFLPLLVSNEKFVQFIINNFVAKNLIKNNQCIVKIENPHLATGFSTNIKFSADNIYLSRIDEEKILQELFHINNLNLDLSIKNILNKQISIHKLGANDIYADGEKLDNLFPKQEQTSKNKSNFSINLFDSILYIDKCFISYKLPDNILIKINANNLNIDNRQKDERYIHFDFETDILKDNNTVNIAIKDDNKVVIKNKHIYVNDCPLIINKSKMFFDAEASSDRDFEIKIYAKRFFIPDVIKLLQTNIIENNIEEPLEYIKNINGDFDFNIKITPNDFKGNIKINKLAAKLQPLANMPFTISSGDIKILQNDILLENFQGYYDNKISNDFMFEGKVKDYLKSLDTNIEMITTLSNDFIGNYLSKTAGINLSLIGKDKAKILIHSINNKFDVTMMGRIKKGDDILVEGASLSPTGYDRALKADLHIDGDNLNIETINYYIAKELNKSSKGIKPILTINGNLRISDGKIYDIGFDIPKPLPSEFLNVLIGQKLFKKGEFSGNMRMIATGDYPILEGNMTANKILIPSQRLFLEEGKISTDNNSININAKGRYRRCNYIFNGNIINSLIYPIIVKHTDLTIDDIDIERIMKAFTTPVEQPQISNNNNDDDDDNNENDALSFDIKNLIIEESIINIIKGKYKEINFGNIEAKMSLDKNSIFKMKSNRFDIAEGHSSADINCDLQNQKYSIKLGIKDVNSDIMSTALLNLKREISGKASGLISLNTDSSLKLNGEIKFIIKNGTIQKIGLVEYVLKFAALFRNPFTMISPSIFSDLVNIPEGNFDKITGEMKLKNNIIELIKIKSYSPQLSAYIVGMYNLENSDSILRIYTKFSNKNKGFAGILRNISLNSLANRIPLNSRNEINYYSAELAQLPDIDADEKDCQIFLTKVDGDVEHNNFISSLKKIK